MELLDLSTVWGHPLFLRGIQRSDACGAAGDLGQRVLVQSPPGASAEGFPASHPGEALGETKRSKIAQGMGALPLRNANSICGGILLRDESSF